MDDYTRANFDDWECRVPIHTVRTPLPGATRWRGHRRRFRAGGLVCREVMVGAGVLVDGVPAFSVRPPGPMRLTGARQLGDSNIALLLYSLG